MIIRQETPEDFEKIYSLVKQAFETAEHSDGNEQDLVYDLRKSESFVPELALVAEVDGELAGHIMFTEGKVGEDTILVLAPLSVSPDFQKQGIGTALINESHKIAKAMGYQYILVLGSEKYYPRAGYQPAEQFGIEVPEGIPSINFMAIKVAGDAAPVKGAVTYPKEFGMEETDSGKIEHSRYLDITGLLSTCKSEGLPFFLTICYCVSQAANSVPEFRRRIMPEGIIEFDRCKTSHTVALEDGTYCYCTLRSDMAFSEYIAYAQKEQETARQKRSIEEESSDTLDLFFISTLPRATFTSLIQPVPIPADSNPRITWGKYFQEGQRTFMPVAVLCHHALVDGIHISNFFENLNMEFIRISGKNSML